MFSIRKREDPQKLNEAISLQTQAQKVRLQEQLGEQNYHEDAKKNI